MTVFLSMILLVGAAFNVVAWPPFLRRVAKDPRARNPDGSATRFLQVHVVLIGTALAIAGISAGAAIVALVTGAV